MRLTINQHPLFWFQSLLVVCANPWQTKSGGVRVVPGHNEQLPSMELFRWRVGLGGQQHQAINLSGL